ncbi:NAD(P)-binding protein [Cylindrobasidium torrendii FP15055 ss-10]|uniref:NAD(P)-binding protein n=1 Tax=Cylindrobasidium torrendii FP15055 ss-10 TaxID=1314674 RepID=A0A0D7BE67_9AGAR|nr:NAD(P)-binding protein [Cylindrobasidium torrendii FP15055 ss-10]
MTSVITNPRILLLGGHGKVALAMTPRLLAKGWSVTSVVRNPEHEADIRATAPSPKGTLDVLVSSLDEISTQEDANQIIARVKPHWLIWSAGAGGKGGAVRTNQIDHLAAVAFIRAAAASANVTTFLMVSAFNSRRSRPSWWTDEDWESIVHMNTVTMPDYYRAKIAADEVLTAVAQKRDRSSTMPPMRSVVLRPGWLTDDEPTGKIQLGKTKGTGKVPRADVAETAVRLLEAVQRGWDGGWVDLLSGENDIDSEIGRVVNANENSIDGENLQDIFTKA